MCLHLQIFHFSGTSSHVIHILIRDPHIIYESNINLAEVFVSRKVLYNLEDVFDVFRNVNIVENL